jgi:hypothetical protein
MSKCGEPTAPDSTPDFACELFNIRFPSYTKGEMRVSMSVGKDSSVLIWAESKVTKAQWQLEVKEIAKHGPAGLPTNVVFSVLKVTSMLP